MSEGKSLLYDLLSGWTFCSMLVRGQKDGGRLLFCGVGVADRIANERDNRGTWYQTHRIVDDTNRIFIAVHDPIHVDEMEELIAESARHYTTMKGKLHDDGAAASGSGSDQMRAYGSVMNILDELRLHVLLGY